MNEKDKDDIRFLLALVPDWAKSMPYPSMDPSLYGTHSYEGDKKVVERVNRIREKLLEEKEEDGRIVYDLIDSHFYFDEGEEG